MPLNCALQMVNFMLCVLYDNKIIKGEGQTLSRLAANRSKVVNCCGQS